MLKYLCLSMCFALSGQVFAMGSKRYQSAEEIRVKYQYVDVNKVTNQNALVHALRKYDRIYHDLENKDYLTLIDFNKHSGKKRFFMIDMRSGKVKSFYTSHGSGGDPDHDGYINEVSNIPDSHMSSVGFYKTAETYSGKHDYSLKLDGLSYTNSKARERFIVIHGASYVNSSFDKMGRSWGCPALEKRHTKYVIDKIKEGSLILAFHKSAFNF